MHAYRERRRSDNPTLWVVTTTGDQSCRMSHRTSKCERKSGLRSLPAPAYAASWPLVAKIARPKIARPVSTAGENPPGVLFAGRRNRALVFGSSVSPLRFGVALRWELPPGGGLQTQSRGRLSCPTDHRAHASGLFNELDMVSSGRLRAIVASLPRKWTGTSHVQ